MNEKGKVSSKLDPKVEMKIPETELTVEVIQKLKEENPRGVFKVVVMEDVYVVRTLEREEYVNMSNDTETSITEKEELISCSCIVWPNLSLKEVQKLPAGVPTTLAEQIMARSGFEAVSVEKL